MSYSVVSGGDASVERGRVSTRFLNRHLLPIMIVGLAVAFLPVLLVYLPQLWAREYYRFFPFAFLATVGLAVARMDPQVNSNVSISRWVVRILVFAAAESLLVAGIMIDSVWPCYVAFVATLGLILDFWNERDCLRSLSYLVLPVVVTVRPPLNLDLTGVQELQAVTSKIASMFLSILHVDHLLAGNIIQPMIGGELMVDEACSGVQSLYTLIFIAALMGVYRRYTLFRTSILMGSAVFWALMMNVFRISAIAIAQTQFQVDLASGWKHDAVGYAGILLAVAFLFSTDRFVFFLVGGIPDDVRLYPSTNVFVVFWNWLFVSADIDEKSNGEHRPVKAINKNAKSITGTNWSVLGSALAAILFVSLISAAAAWRSVQPFSGGGTSESSLAVQLPVASDWLSAEAFPNCSLLKFDTEHRVNSAFGDFSDQWTIATPIGAVRHSIDHPFFGYHDLTVCYRNIGWQMTSVKSQPVSGDDSSWPVVVSEFVRPTAERAVVCFSAFTLDGVGITGVEGKDDELRRKLEGFRNTTEQTVQIQTLYQSFVPATPAVIDELVAYHGKVRLELRGRVVLQMSKSGASVATASLPATVHGGQP